MKLQEMTWPQVQKAASEAVAVVPIGSTEQHGLHLAVSTDAALVTAVAEGAERALPEGVVICPTLAYGASHHHLGFAGTMSLSPETYTRVLLELLESLLRGGFRRIVLLNGHGGNIVPANQALLMLSHRYDDELQPNIALTSYWELAGAAFRGRPPLESSCMRHADEYETSMMLWLHPEHVLREAIAPPQMVKANSHLDWQGERPDCGVTMQKKFHFLTDSGVVGYPDLATAEKGRHLVERAVEAAIDFLREFRQWPLMEDLREKTCENK
jgi:creatinine amidohydrolase